MRKSFRNHRSFGGLLNATRNARRVIVNQSAQCLAKFDIQARQVGGV